MDDKAYKSLLVEFKHFPKEAGEAVYHAVNRTLDSCETKVGRIVTQAYAIKVKEVKEAALIRRPSRSDMTANILFAGHTLSMSHFPHTPGAPRRGKYQVKVQIKKSGGKKVLGTDPKPFIAGTGARSADKVQFNVFRREGKDRLPIIVPRTLSIPQMVSNEQVTEKIMAHAGEVFEKRLAHELERAIMSMDKKVKG